VESVPIPFCDDHRLAHKPEWENLVSEQVAKRRKKDAEVAKVAATEAQNARIPNAKTVVAEYDRLKPIPDLFWKACEVKTEPSVEEAVNVLLREFCSDTVKYLDVNVYSTFRLFPCHYRGWSSAELAEEFRNRLYSVSVVEEHEKGCSLCIRSKYFFRQ
jgi:hypothetical protein